ncbi:MAG: Asp-tRNA(Asn)/Glu-tRNA(Gln) amidotransferase subunit GatA [Ruminococcaceae bacterium]|nr:Asp-tRNA(Asn)/Glu-tRNA(Gln) amidotransferase subunit GatA [Oscillospiraceae bacterium]
MKKRFLNMTLHELSLGLSRRDFSSFELTEAFLERINETDKEIGAFISICAEKALARAKETDALRASGEHLGPLAGIPFAVKDNICTRGIRTTCGSRMLEDFIPPYNATVIDKLEREGCVMLGKLNMDEFAMGSATDTSVFGRTKNPLDIRRTAGGSSGGAAAAVAALDIPFALGSDTGGSVRQPAAFCGAVGIKPTYGTVSRYGLVAFASSLDQIGPITRDVLSNATVLSAIAGADGRDATCVQKEHAFLSDLGRDIKGVRIGLPKEVLEGVSPDVAACTLSAIDALSALGAEVVEITLPNTDALLAAYYIISSAEASSNLARFDGVRYGRRAEGAENIDGLLIKSRSEGFGDEVKRRIMLGTYALSRDVRDTYYKKALAVRAHLSSELKKLYEKCDVILMPTAPTVAYTFENKKATPIEVYLEDKLCVIANMAGVPSLSLPFGRGEGDMPVGIQLMGKVFDEALLYRIAMSLERAEGGTANERI